MMNKFAVGINGAQNVSLVLPFVGRVVLTAEDALELAAWIAVVVDPGDQKFSRLVERARHK